MSQAALLACLRLVSWAIALIPPGFGQPRLAAPIYRRWLARGGGPMLRARLRGGARVSLDLQDRIQGMTFLTREYEPALVRFLASQLAGGGVFVDVGAHVGLVSLSVASRCRGSSLKVHAFEPDPANAAALRENIALNPGLDVTLYPFAAGAGAGRALLQRAGDRERACATIVEGDGAGGGEQIEVETVPLASYLAERGVDYVDVLKVDAEGYEPQVLEGADPLLRHGRVGWVICEINDERLASRGLSRKDVCDRLAAYGYRLSPVPERGLRRVIPRSPGPDEDLAFRFDASAAGRSGRAVRSRGDVLTQRS